MIRPHRQPPSRRLLLAAAAATLVPRTAGAQTEPPTPTVVRELADLVEREYHDAELGRAAAITLRRKLDAGGYGDLTGDPLAAQLMADLQ